MTSDAIEREIFIQAGIDHVWSLVSSAGFWVGEDLHFDAEAVEGDTVMIDTAAYGRFPVRVERLEPPRYAAYRWASGFPGADLTAENSTLVEFTLVEQDGGAMVRLRESGFASLAGAQDFRDSKRADNVAGWAAQLEQLRLAAESIAA
jgi:uncharacterized protein YndB with AHSA1/START domain